MRMERLATIGDIAKELSLESNVQEAYRNRPITIGNLSAIMDAYGMNPYKRIQYVESNGSQYIDTQIRLNENSKITADFQFTKANSTQGLFGHRGRGSSYKNRFGLYHFSNNTWRFDYGTSNYSFGKSDTNRNSMTIENGKITIGSQSTTAKSAVINSDCDMYLFANDTGGNASEFASVKIYDFKVTVDNTTYHFIPVKRKNNGEAGMYETTMRVFYPSKTSTKLIAGPEIV